MSEQTNLVTTWLDNIAIYRDAVRERRAETAAKRRNLRPSARDYDVRLMEHADAAITLELARERYERELHKYDEYLQLLSLREYHALYMLHLDETRHSVAEVAGMLRVPISRVGDYEKSAIERLARRIRMDTRAGGSRGASPRVQ